MPFCRLRLCSDRLINALYCLLRLGWCIGAPLAVFARSGRFLACCARFWLWLLCFCRVDFPLECAGMPLKRSVFDFRALGYTLGRVRAFNALVGGFRAFRRLSLSGGCARLPSCLLPSAFAFRPSWASRVALVAPSVALRP